jgi:hypothetical protein
MNQNGMDRREAMAALLGLTGGLAGCSGAEQGYLLEESVAATTEALTASEQYALWTKCNSFWKLENVVRIDITMPAADWTALKLDEPAGGACTPSVVGGRYPWRKATSIKITGGGSAPFPASPITVTSAIGIGIKKKSWCGSKDETVPCLKIDVGEWGDSAAATALENAIGTSRLTLNNSKQDASFARQVLGYQLFKLAGLPYARCNLCTVYVNGVKAGVFVNVEPIHKRYLDNNFGVFSGTTLTRKSGNLYELEFSEDFNTSTSAIMEAEGCSKYDEGSAYKRRDFSAAVTEVTKNTVAGLSSALDINQFLRVYAMEFLLRHWDGYSGNRNNTYLYNNVEAVPNPVAPANVRFAFLPWGLDQILQPGAFDLWTNGVAAQIVRADAATTTLLVAQIAACTASALSRANLNVGGQVANLLNQIETTLNQLLPKANVGGAWVDTTSAERVARINEVRKQLRAARSAGLAIGGLGSQSVYLLQESDGHCLHASNTELLGSNYETYHRAPEDSGSDRWTMPQGSWGGQRLVSEAYASSHRYLSCSSPASTPGGHTAVTTTNLDVWNYSDFFVIPEATGSYSSTGYFRIRGSQTGLYLKYGTDDFTPNGRPRVYADAHGSKLYYF